MIQRVARQGFTLIEVMIATILIGLAVAALVGANGAHTMVNDAGARLSTAEFLMEQIRELTTSLPVVDPEDDTSFGAESGESDPNQYDDVDDYDGSDSNGTVFSPPIDATGTSLSIFDNYSQTITVTKIDPDDFQTPIDDSLTSDFIRVNVDVSYNGTVLSSASWIRARY